MTDDPFATLNPTDAAPQDAAPSDAASDAESYFAAEMVIGEDEFEQPKEFVPYTMPEDRTWVPVEVIKADVASRTMRVLVADAKGEKVPTEVEIDQFVLEVQHLSTAYGERAYPYRLYVPVFDIELPTKNGRTWTKSSGRKLLAATRVTKPGQRITPETLPELAKAMEGKQFMGQIRHVTKDYTDSKPRTNPDGSFVKAKADEDGAPIRVIEAGGNLVLESSDTPCPVGKERLIPYKDNSYLIPDPDGVLVRDMVTTTKTFDNLQDDVAPIPNREIVVTLKDGAEAKGVVTLETVGRMATRPVKPGTEVTVEKDGNQLIASWLGTSWNEASVDAVDVFKGDAA